MASGGSRDLDVLLDGLAGGAPVAKAALTALSGLDTAGVQRVRDTWARIPPGSREQLLTDATALAEDNVDLDFTAVARVALRDEDAAVRTLAVDALWESEDRHVADELRALLANDPSGDVRAAAARGLRSFVLAREFEQFDELQGDRIVAALRAAAEDESQPNEVRAMALESLGPRSLPWVANLIEDAYYSDDPQRRLSAINAMGASADERWTEFVIEQLSSDDPAFRFEAAGACGEIASEDAVEPLLPLLDDEDAEVAGAAVSALGEIGGDEALAHLREFRRRAPAALADVVDEAIDNARSLAAMLGQGEEE